MTHYFVWTERWGFEPVMFANPDAAVRHVDHLSSLLAYQNEPPFIREISSEALEDAAVIS